MNGGFDIEFPFKVACIFIGNSKDGILPHESQFIQNKEGIPEIPSKYYDVFELLSSGIMQMNYFKNYKLAILEAFVAVEVLVVRITNDQKLKRGISKSKISEFKQAIDLAHRMDVELKIFFEFNPVEESLIGQMVRARKIRNDIMHNNKPVDYTEIITLIKYIRDFLFMLIKEHESLE